MRAKVPCAPHLEGREKEMDMGMGMGMDVQRVSRQKETRVHARVCKPQ